MTRVASLRACLRAAVFGAVLESLSPIGGQPATQAGGPVHGIAFASFAPLNTDIVIADADGSNAKPLLAHHELDSNPSFSPVGGWMRRLTHSPGNDAHNAWSRDGEWIVFTSATFREIRRMVGVMLAAVARPSGPGPFPVVVVLHGTHGFAQEYVRWAQDLARGVFLAVAPCWFSGGTGRSNRHPYSKVTSLSWVRAHRT